MWGPGYDLGAAQRYLDVACRGDIGAACRELGLVTARATATPAVRQEAAPPARSPEEVAAYERACLLADGQGCYELGLCHLDGGGCEANPGRAFELFGQGCELTYADACLRQGDLIAQDPSLSPRPAFDFYKLGCGHGSMAGCERLAEAVQGGASSSALAQDLNLQVVVMGLESGCNRQLAQSCHTLGLLYDRGWGVGADAARSQQLVDMACRMGYTPACHELAARKVLGHGAIAAEPEAGMTLLAELCQTGYVPSCAALLEYAQTVQGTAASLEGVDLSSPSDIAAWTCQLGYQIACDAGLVLGPR